MFTILKGGVAPKIKTEFSSSADLCSRGDITIGAGETKIIPLGVKINLDYFKDNFIEKTYTKDDDNNILKGVVFNQYEYSHFLKSHFLELKLRSSLAIKKGLIIANGTGEIDLDYPDEIGLIVHNPVRVKQIVENGVNYTILEDREDTEVTIKAGERVAQIKLMPHKNYLMPDEYRSDDKRVGGFGSTGSEG